MLKSVGKLFEGYLFDDSQLFLIALRWNEIVDERLKYVSLPYAIRNSVLFVAVPNSMVATYGTFVSREVLRRLNTAFPSFSLKMIKFVVKNLKLFEPEELEEKLPPVTEKERGTALEELLAMGIDEEFARIAAEGYARIRKKDNYR